MNCCNSGNKPEEGQDATKAALSKRIETIGWGLFLMMIGGLMLVPKGQVPEATWLIGVGFIMLGVNIARRFNGLRMDCMMNGLGVIALIFGLSSSAGMNLPLFPILLVLVGGSVLAKALFKKSEDKPEA